MRGRGYLGLTTALVSGCLVLAACASGRRAPPAPPPPPPVLQGEAAPVNRGAPPAVSAPTTKPGPPARGKRTRGRDIDPACRYCVTDDAAKRQYFDQRRNRYYYFDRGRKAYFWENGEPKV